MTQEEQIDVRIFYWAAFYGLNKYVRYMILNLKWSPFIKSFSNRSIISGAVWGEKIETVRMLIGDYIYENSDHESLINFQKTIFNKDLTDNNCLHYSYMKDLPEVRQILRDNGLYYDTMKLNRRGQMPTKLRHFTKAEDSDIDTDDEAQYE